MESIEEEHNEHLADKDIPKFIKIDDYEYSYKERKANFNYAYRCRKRQCGILISIDEINLKKIISKKDNEVISYTKVTKKEHSCKSNIVNTSINNIKLETEDIKLAEEMIKKNIDKHLQWHINNLAKNNIQLKKTQVKNLLQNLREMNYPNDIEFLNDISKITISFSSNKKELQNLPFCFTKQIIINTKNNRQEYFVLFTSIFQLKKIKESKQIYMDGTFKCAPKKFYQLYNIIGKDEKSSIIIPLIFILMSNKSFDLYLHIFRYIRFMLERFNINVHWDDKYVMMDFEKGSRKAFNKVFPEAHLMGCYFHYVKSLWKKAKKEGLTRKYLKMDTFVLIFSFKLYQFIPEKEKKDYLKSIIKAFSEKKEYNKYFRYFIKNWSKSNFLDFENLTQDEILDRTDNTCEIFHKILNDAIGINHPKISYLIDNLKKFY